MIQCGATILKNSMGNNKVYRIGGDEFAVVFLNTDRELVKEKISTLELEIERFAEQNKRKEISLQMAMGVAFYDSQTDQDCADVFRKADNAMYIDKERKKTKERKMD